MIANIASAFLEEQNISLEINFDQTLEVDYQALMILNIVICKGQQFLNKRGYKASIFGKTPISLETKRLFCLTSLPRLFGFNDFSRDFEELDPFSKKELQTEETTRVVDYFNHCLNKNGYELNTDGRCFLSKLINEIIDNAYIHSGLKKECYYCGGFYAGRGQKGYLTIVSFGKSMYESLNSSTTDISVIQKINAVLKAQNARMNFRINDEDIWTLCALQQGISSKRNEEDQDRGSGTVEFIESFMKLGQSEKEKQTMSIISGNTQILFDGKYKLKQKSDTEKFKIIAFNEANTLSEPPDKDYVKHIHYGFPGVIIGIEFYIDKQYIDKEEKQND